MKKIILTRGLPASGKSTFAKELMAKEPSRWKRVNKDELRAMLDDGKWSSHNEKFILKVRDMLIVQALDEGFNVIVDDCNLAEKHLVRISDLVKGKAKVEIKDFTDVSVDECIKRDQKRANYVGEKVIRQMYRQFLQPKSKEIVYDKNLPDAILCDLDGTLALFGNKNPYDRDFENDKLNEAVANVIFSLQEDIYPIFVSGRDSKYRNITLDWIAEKLNWDKKDLDRRLFMRPESDNRKDVIIKQEIYEQHIKNKYNVLYILDDRMQVVQYWRSLGLTVFQVADGEF